MSGETKKPETVLELVTEMYDNWKDEPNFINDIKAKSADDFAISLHDSTGREIRNDYLWVKGSKIHKECLELGFDHPDDMSNYILVELHNYTTQKLNENQEVIQQTEEQIANELNGLHVLDWYKLDKEFPLSIQALKDWFITRLNVPTARIVTEQFTMLLTDGTRGMFLNPRDLYDFFDGYDVRPFTIPYVSHIPDGEINEFPKCTFVIQSKRSIKKFDNLEDIFEDRASCEIASFIKTFFYIEVTIQHDIEQLNKTK
jgi:hypothetical protein